MLILVPIPNTFLVFLARFIFSSDPELELLELLPEELLPDDEDPLLLDEPELELDAFRFFAGARFLAGPFLAGFFLSSEELVPDEELLLDDDFFLFPVFAPAFLAAAGLVCFLPFEELLEEEELFFLSVVALAYLPLLA